MLFSGFAPAVEQPQVLDVYIRRRAVRSLFDAIRTRSQTPLPDSLSPELARIAVAIEHGICVWSEAKARPYSRKLYSILWALRQDVAVTLSRAEPWDLAFLKEDSLLKNEKTAEANTALAALTAKMDRLEATLKARLSAPRRSCPRCGCKDMERIALQLRAADEGMTTMLQCTNCSQRIRI